MASGGTDLRARIGTFKNEHDKICFDTWFENFELVCDANNIPKELCDANNIPKELCDEQRGVLPGFAHNRKHLFLVSLSDEVLRSLNGVCFPKNASDLPLSVLADNMRKMCCPFNLVLSRYKFNRRDQQKNESGRDYIKALEDLASHCKFGEFHQEALRDRLVCGLRVDESFVSCLLSTEDLTFAKACYMVRNYYDLSPVCRCCGRQRR